MYDRRLLWLAKNVLAQGKYKQILDAGTGRPFELSLISRSQEDIKEG